MIARLPGRIEEILREAGSRGASDVHLIPGEPPALRVGPEIERMDAEPLTVEEVEEVAKVVMPVAPEIVDGIGELHKSVTVGGDINVRIAVARSNGQCTVAMRLLPGHIPAPSDLAMPEPLLRAASAPSGLVVISGKSGSGKATTAYSLVEHINATRPCHICTVEDPIQYRLTPKRALVQQREVRVDVPGITPGIRACLLQDPDVIFIPEVTSLDDLQACITAAEVGHLVIIVMHASAPEDALERIIEVFGDDARPMYRKALSRVLLTVSTQQLLPRSDRPGRVAAYAVLVPDDEMRTAIADGRNVLDRNTPLPEGCRTMQEDVERLRSDGVIGG